MSAARRPARGRRPSTAPRARAAAAAAAAPAKWELRLYIAGQTPKSIAALSNLERICAEHLEGTYRIEVIDLLQNPKLARGDQILAVPTLVRKVPEPMKKIIGDLSNEQRVLVGLDVRHLGGRKP